MEVPRLAIHAFLGFSTDLEIVLPPSINIGHTVVKVPIFTKKTASKAKNSLDFFYNKLAFS